VDPILFAAIGWLLGWWLWGRPVDLADDPALADADPAPAPRTTIVIPARDEAAVLPLLLGDLAADAPDGERRVVVIDDHSTDGTAEVARSFAGVTVLAAPDLPAGWTGKSWACHSAVHALDLGDDDVLVFLDADVRVARGAVDDAVRLVERHGGVVSVQPFHTTERAYEQLSLYPGIIGFLGTGAGHHQQAPTGVYGPLLATTARDYRAVGGHAAVRTAVAEDVALGIAYRDAGLPVAIRLGGDRVRFRMYPAGVRQLAEGWTKNMATGAKAVPLHRSLGAFWWIAGSGSAAISLPFVPGNAGVAATTGIALYLAFVVQLRMMARRTGTFSWPAIALYPVAMVAFVGLFVRSLWRSQVRRSVRWRGRTIPLHEAHHPA